MKSTREGKRFFLAAFMIALAAFNTGNNLIYLILSMMLAIFFLSIIVLKINMRKLVLKVYQDNPVYADTPCKYCHDYGKQKTHCLRFVKVMSSGIATEGMYFPPYRWPFGSNREFPGHISEAGYIPVRGFSDRVRIPVYIFYTKCFHFRKG